MPSISEKYLPFIKDMIRNCAQSAVTTEENVFQPGNRKNRPYVDKVIMEHLLPGSRAIGVENLEELHRLSASGKSCLILMEHYSNFDIPAFIYLLEQSGEKGRAAAESIIAISGIKLNAENPAVLAFAEAYSRLVIYPSRYFDSITDPEVLKEERKKSNSINRAALHEMIRCKHSGNIILVFPSGTRFRPGVPETKRGLKEIDSYIKAFDYMIFIGSGGNLLRISPDGGMSEDQLFKDKVVFKAGPVITCEEFRSLARREAPPEADTKQFTVDRVMEALERLHEEIEKIRETDAS